MSAAIWPAGSGEILNLDEHRRANLANWNDRVPIHWDSDSYAIPRFIAEPEFISQVVDFDQTELGDVSGKTLLHLQCHIGTDTLSWARLGAEVTGVDFSEPAVEAARKLSAESGTPGRFVVSELYSSPAALPGKQFDVVYTGVGAICWLPDIRGWAEVVHGFLKPGGTFYVRDSHPIVNSLQWDRDDGLYNFVYSYFEDGPVVITVEDVTYAGKGKVEHKVSYEYSHGLAEIIMAAKDAGLDLDFVREHRFCDWQSLKQTVRGDDGRWRMPRGEEHLLPLMFSLRASRPE